MSYFDSVGSGFLEGGKSLISISIVYSPIGFLEPLTVTLSIYLESYFKESEKQSYKSAEINKGTPYYLVAASKREAIFTLGLK